jgi:hypothetical protein
MAVIAGTWTLQKATQAAAESAFGLGGAEDESVFDEDNRTLVDAADFAPGGKYRCKIPPPVMETDLTQ